MKDDFELLDKVRRIILVQKPADLRKGIDGYTSVVQGLLRLDPTDSSLYLFVNRQKDKMKGILHDGNGYWLIYKRLARSHLQWPVSSDESDFVEVSCTQLQLLLSGMMIHPHPDFLPRKLKCTPSQGHKREKLKQV